MHAIAQSLVTQLDAFKNSGVTDGGLEAADGIADLIRSPEDAAKLAACVAWEVNTQPWPLRARAVGLVDSLASNRLLEASDRAVDAHELAREAGLEGASITLQAILLWLEQQSI